MAITFSLADLNGFHGTTRYVKHWGSSLLMTEGVWFVHEHGLAWLVNEIACAQGELQREQNWQVWSLEVNAAGSGVLTCCGPQYVEEVPAQELKRIDIVYCDWPIAHGRFELWYQRGVLMLPSEY